jgi:hypothetical protein
MKVGIFFKIESKFLIDTVDVENGEPYGEALQHGGHYDFHQSFNPSLPHERRFLLHDYDYYPRGRVVFFPKTNKFVLYADPCLSANDIQQVMNLFYLSEQTVEVAEDQHYRCAQCNKNYLE